MSALSPICSAMNLGNSIATGPGIAARLRLPVCPSASPRMVMRMRDIWDRTALASVKRYCASGTGTSFRPFRWNSCNPS